MGDEKIKVECRLITRGTDKVDAQAVDDLSVPDPELAIGKKVIENAISKEDDDDDS